MMVVIVVMVVEEMAQRLRTEILGLEFQRA